MTSKKKKKDSTLKVKKRTTVVREHPRRVPISKKNPSGITIVDSHPRRLPGTYLDIELIKKTFKSYSREGLVYPTSKKLKEEYKNSDKYDDLIAIWTDYFNKKFNAKPPIDPDTIKALIASESGFRADPPENKIALGITQITKPTLKILQDPKGEVQQFTFKGIRQKDLKVPSIAIPMGIRWLFRKRATAASKLKRPPTNIELILEYKGLLKSRTPWKRKALENFKKHYKNLKKK